MFVDISMRNFCKQISKSRNSVYIKIHKNFPSVTTLPFVRNCVWSTCHQIPNKHEGTPYYKLHKLSLSRWNHKARGPWKMMRKIFLSSSAVSIYYLYLLSSLSSRIPLLSTLFDHSYVLKILRCVSLSMIGIGCLYTPIAILTGKELLLFLTYIHRRKWFRSGSYWAISLNSDINRYFPLTGRKRSEPVRVDHVAYITFLLKTNKLLLRGLWMAQTKTGVFFYMLDATTNKRYII